MVFGKLAETCTKYLSKGRQIYVEGRLQTQEFESKNGGGKRQRTEIVAQRVAAMNSWPWLLVVAMGAYHGFNPAMGWLFAVSLGFQERRRAKVIEALLPIALGHLVSIGLAVTLIESCELAISPRLLQILGGTVLTIFGVFRFFSSRHFRWIGMRVSPWDLVLWSFLMASAHGAGLMLFPVLINLPLCGRAGTYASVAQGVPTFTHIALAVVLIHTAAMLAVMGTVAILVYDRIGLGILRTAWINVDKLWAIALMSSGLIVLIG